MPRQRRLIQRAEFQAALRSLESPNARWMVEELARVLGERPQCGPAMGGSEFHVLRTNPYEEFPALLLFYGFDDEAVYLLDVEVYDPLLPEEG